MTQRVPIEISGFLCPGAKYWAHGYWGKMVVHTTMFREHLWHKLMILADSDSVMTQLQPKILSQGFRGREIDFLNVSLIHIKNCLVILIST